MATILEGMTWTNYEKVPALTKSRIKNKKADPHEGITIEEIDSDTDTYRATDGTIIMEIQIGELRLRSQYQARVQAMEDDLIAELPGQGCSIKTILRPRQKNKYESIIQIERLA